MRVVPGTLVGLLLCVLATASGTAQGPAATVTDTSLRAFLPGFEEATSRFLNGDPAPWKQNASHRDDATIMGAWGAYEKGWNEVGPRYDWASGHLKESGTKVKVEYLSSGVSGDLAYTVAIERSDAHRVGQDRPTPAALRVTHGFRKEEGGWKLLHRHADPLMEKRAPGGAAIASTAGAAAPPSGIQRVAWLQGCWEAVSPERTIDENWMAPRGNSMVGISRTVRDGKLVEHELVVIREQGDQLAYEAHPFGQSSAVFLSGALDDTTVVFENQQHDFPKRIGYRRSGPDRLLAWIEGDQKGQMRRIEFPYRRAACGGR